MIEDLKQYFQDILDKQFKQLNSRIDKLESQISQNKKELESTFMEKSDQTLLKFQNLEKEFQSLLKQLDNAQKQANEIIQNVASNLAHNQNFSEKAHFIKQGFVQDQNLRSIININEFVNQDQKHTPQENLQKQSEQNNYKDGIENVVFKTKTGKKYHRAYCEFLSKSKIPITLREAIKIGLSSCSICQPFQNF